MENVVLDRSVQGPACSPTAMSIDVEDWFHAENMQVSRGEWERHELRVERNTMRMLEILEVGGARATFFVLGWVAERCPQLVRAISAAGHEVASHGHGHKLVYSISPDEFREDVVRSKKHLEDLTGAPVYGYRAPCFSITDWSVPILQEVGFRYDSSCVPTVSHDRYGQLSGTDAENLIVPLGDRFCEVCLPSLRIGRRGVPWGGGGYFRLFPYRLWRYGMRRILRSGKPYVFYIHPWEIDPGQPRRKGPGLSYQFRHRVNLQRCEERFAALVGDFDWVPVWDLVERWEAANTCTKAISAGLTAEGREREVS